MQHVLVYKITDRYLEGFQLESQKAGFFLNIESIETYVKALFANYQNRTKIHFTKHFYFQHPVLGVKH